MTAVVLLEVRHRFLVGSVQAAAVDVDVGPERRSPRHHAEEKRWVLLKRPRSDTDGVCTGWVK